MALTDNITHYYKFDADNSNDSVGSANGSDTTVTYGAAKINDGGSINNAGYINFGTAVGGTAAFTYNLWVKCGTPANAYSNIIGRSAAGGNAIILLQQSDGKVLVAINASGGDVTFNNNTALNTGGATWQMITLTYSSTDGARFYLNGSADGTAAANGTAPTSSVNFFVGKDEQFPTTRYFVGAFDEVGVWSRVLSSTEITALYNSGSGLQYPFSTSIAYTCSSVNTVNLSNTNAMIYGGIFSKSETIFLSDSSVFVATYQLNISKTINLSDDHFAGSVLAVTETITLSDSKAFVTALGVVKNETLSLSDSKTVSLTMFQSVTETINLSDSSVEGLTLGITVSETVRLSDSKLSTGWHFLDKNTTGTWTFSSKDSTGSWTFRAKGNF